MGKNPATGPVQTGADSLTRAFLFCPRQTTRDRSLDYAAANKMETAAMTIKALEMMWVLGNQTAELIITFRAFDNDARLLEAKIRDEISTGKYMKHLLFDSSAVYDSKTLFDQFDYDVQSQILVFFEQSTGVLHQALQVLTRLFGTRDADHPKLSASSSDVSSISSVSTAFTYEYPKAQNPNSPGLWPSQQVEPIHRKPSPLKRLWWSVYDKRRIETILAEFSDLNARNLRKIQLWCLGAELRVDRGGHLLRLESDPNSKALGFDVDARLQISTTQGVSSPMGSEELEVRESKVLMGDMPAIQDVLGGRFGISRWDGRPVLVEYRKYAPESPVPVMLDDRTREVIDRLAKVLHQPKETIFRMPNCLGWTSQAEQNRVALFFSIPENSQPSPISLLDIIVSSPTTPSLGSRFTLALRLARCISQLQLVKWVHESFRSENILFYPRVDVKHENAEDQCTPHNIDLTEPWVLGFENSRPDPFFSAGRPDKCPERDVYRHPSRQQTPTQHFNKLHDIYALGVVLLEIGLWQEALSLEKGRFAKVREPLTIKKQLVKNAEKRLGAKMGNRYRDVVVRCLEAGFDVVNDTKEELKLQQAFRETVVDVLERSADNI